MAGGTETGRGKFNFTGLNGILNTVLLKDVAVRLGVSNIAALETVTRYMFDAIGNLTDPRSMADAMTSAGTKISAPMGRAAGATIRSANPCATRIH